MAVSRVPLPSSKGINNQADPLRFGKGELVQASNTNILGGGRVKSRAGYTLRASATIDAAWGTFFQSADGLYQFGDDWSPTLLTSGLTPVSIPERLAGKTVGGVSYLSNGHEALRVSNGEVYPWGISTPTGFTVTTAYTGQLLEGLYLAAVTFVRDDGVESGSSDVHTISVPSGGAVVFSDVIGAPTGVTRYNCYLSSSDGKELYFCGTGDIGSSYTVSARDAARYSPMTTKAKGPPPAGQHIEFYQGRTCVASGDTLYWSDPYNLELFSWYSYQTFESAVTGLAALTYVLFVSTEHAVYALRFNLDTQSFDVIRKTPIKAVSGTMIVVDAQHFGSETSDEAVFWWAQDGAYLGTSDGSITPLTKGRYEISDPTEWGASVVRTIEGETLLTTSILTK